jgi:hypothetical protein
VLEIFLHDGDSLLGGVDHDRETAGGLDGLERVGLQLGGGLAWHLDLQGDEVALDASDEVWGAGGGELGDMDLDNVASRKRLGERFLDASLQT